MEMESRQSEGIEFFQQTENNWKDSVYKAHNYWHLGLYYIELEQYQEALNVYDKIIGQPKSPLDLIDASSLLLRLAMENVDVGDRWAESLEFWKPYLGND
jgi:tetratricopeptide (TPR) repeat protein